MTALLAANEELNLDGLLAVAGRLGIASGGVDAGVRRRRLWDVVGLAREVELFAGGHFEPDGDGQRRLRMLVALAELAVPVDRRPGWAGTGGRDAGAAGATAVGEVVGMLLTGLARGTDAF